MTERATGADVHPGDHESAGVADESSVAGLPTGVSDVDDALSGLDGLDETPLAEHLEIFERAHGALRSALDGPSADRSGTPG